MPVAYITNLVTPMIGDSDWTGFITQVETQRRGFINLSVTNLLNSNAPEIQLGSCFDINGSFWQCVIQCPVGNWAGISNSTIAYIFLDGPTANWSASEPTWDIAKGGWYNGSGYRCVGGCYKDGSGNYTNKWLYHNPVVNAQGKFIITNLDVNGAITTQTDITVGNNLKISGTVQANGKFDSGTTIPVHTTRLNYDGDFYATDFISTTDVTVGGNLSVIGTVQATGKFDAGTTAPSHTTRLNYDGAFYANTINVTGLMTSASAQINGVVNTTGKITCPTLEVQGTTTFYWS